MAAAVELAITDTGMLETAIIDNVTTITAVTTCTKYVVMTTVFLSANFEATVVLLPVATVRRSPFPLNKHRRTPDLIHAAIFAKQNNNTTKFKPLSSGVKSSRQIENQV